MIALLYISITCLSFPASRPMRSPHHRISLHFEADSKIQAERSHRLQDQNRSTDLYYSWVLAPAMHLSDRKVGGCRLDALRKIWP